MAIPIFAAEPATACTMACADISQLTSYDNLHPWESVRLRQLERRVRSSLNLSTTIKSTVEGTAALFRAKQVGLFRYVRATQCWQLKQQFCATQSLAWQSSFSLSQTEFPALANQLKCGQLLPLLPCSLSSAKTQIAAEAKRWLSHWPGNWLLVPIRNQQTGSRKGEHWGFMAVAFAETTGYDHQAIAATQSIVAELEIAIKQASQYQALMEANKELRKLALSDGLTCLANRRRFDEHLTAEWLRLARDKQPLSLILCDLDHFKRYNDYFGHPMGDRCLVRISRALLASSQRPTDLVARYGGEEFAIILPNTDTRGAWCVAQKIHNNINALQIDHSPDNEEANITVTMGISTVIPEHNSPPQLLVKASDSALYYAKQKGRNRTYVNRTYISGYYNTASPEGTLNITETANQLCSPVD